MAKLTPQQYTDKWASRLKGAGQQIRDGVANLTVNPCAQAAAASKKWIQKVSDAEGKFVRGLGRVSLEEWKSQLLGKGVQRISSGVDGALAKQVEFASQLLPYTDTVKAACNAMPGLTLDDGINRAVKAIQLMAKFQRK